MADELAELGGAGKPVAGGKKERDRRLAYITIGVGAVGTLIAYLTFRRQAAAAAGTSTSSPGAYSYPTTTGAGTIGVAPSAAYGQDPGTASYDQALLQSLSGLQTQLGGLTGSSPATGTVTPTGAYGSPIYGPTSGGSYTPLGGAQDAMAAANAGIPVYYEPGGPGSPYVEIPQQDIYPGSGYSGVSIFTPNSGPPMLQPAQQVGTLQQGTVISAGRGGAAAMDSRRASAPAGSGVGAVGRFTPVGQQTPGEQFMTSAFRNWPAVPRQGPGRRLVPPTGF